MPRSPLAGFPFRLFFPSSFSSVVSQVHVFLFFVGSSLWRKKSVWYALTTDSLHPSEKSNSRAGATVKNRVAERERHSGTASTRKQERSHPYKVVQVIPPALTTARTSPSSSSSAPPSTPPLPRPAARSRFPPREEHSPAPSRRPVLRTPPPPPHPDLRPSPSFS